ncbi:PREDICTED: thioredoxin-related transmembrane protein 1 [Dinoponera quadriceps]|uniref:Thioredoxin-related transmembrane protein 1 n=1 Tax=Dinoponera quadriceps TaxID=609295 RepID=A0A6P3XQ71_DINQU|nr:PREDICTED: thioredoxin-related transmembrane protein 1 [Dinoponera quadriceps]
MSLVRMGLVFYISCIALISAHVSANAQDSLVVQLNEDNWDLMLTGEWMVEFYAPWCPACQSLEEIWKKFAKESSDQKLNINVGKIDVTNSPGLSGRFMVTALPTIFHVNDGVFRQYKSPRDKDSLIEFILEKTWTKVEPIPSWKSPTAFHMSILSQFFKLSQVLRAIHTRLLEEIGLPAWGSYLIFAIATIILGGIMGLFIVCLIDFIYPPKPTLQPSRQGKKKQNGTVTAQEKGSDEDELSENVGDDLVDESEPEELAETPEEAKGEEVSEPEELEASEKETDTKTDTSSPSVRKRKPRKAD